MIQVNFFIIFLIKIKICQIYVNTSIFQLLLLMKSCSHLKISCCVINSVGNFNFVRKLKSKSTDRASNNKSTFFFWTFNFRLDKIDCFLYITLLLWVLGSQSNFDRLIWLINFRGEWLNDIFWFHISESSKLIEMPSKGIPWMK